MVACASLTLIIFLPDQLPILHHIFPQGFFFNTLKILSQWYGEKAQLSTCFAAEHQDLILSTAPSPKYLAPEHHCSLKNYISHDLPSNLPPYLDTLYLMHL